MSTRLKCSLSSVYLLFGVLCCLSWIIYTMEARHALSRDDILSYRYCLHLSTCTLDRSVRDVVSQLRLHRRGCRAGASYRRRLQGTVPSSATPTYTRAIPVVIDSCRQNRNVNNRREAGFAGISVLQPVRFCSRSSESTQSSPPTTTTTTTQYAPRSISTSPTSLFNGDRSAQNDDSSLSATLCDFYSVSPVSMLSVRTQPHSFDNSLSPYSNDSTHSVSIAGYDTGRPIYCSNFKPTCRKSFHFPVFILSNIRGGFATKLDELQQLLDSNDVDIAIIVETWLHDDIDSKLLELSGYTLFRLDRRDGRQGGGVAVYVKHGCYCTPLSHLTHANLEVLWLLYRPHSMPREVTHVTIGALYHPPKANNAEMLDYLVSTMDEVTRTHPQSGIMLLGDFNQLPDSQLKSFPLHQIVNSATRGNAILDKIYTNIPSWFQTPIPFPPVSRSDHNTVCLQPAVDPPRPPRSVKVIYRRLVSPNRKSLLYNQLSHLNWTPLFRMSSCNEMVDLFYSVLTHWLDFYMPTVRVSVNNLSKPWVTKKFQDLVKQRQRAFLASQTVLYRSLRNKVNRLAASLRKTYYEKKVEALRSADAHSWWKKTKQFLYSHQADCFRDLHRQFPDLSLAEEINDFFVSVSAHFPPFDLSSLNSLTPDHSDQYIIEPSQVEHRLLHINVHKSSGPDGLPNWLLKEFAPIICQPLAAIFNASLREGYVPPLWKSVEIVPVPKINPPSSIQNDLRPIAILPVLAKVFESMVGRELLKFLEPNLDDTQFGSRKRRSTTHAIIALLHSWMESLDCGGSVRSVFVDFRKAFDLVDHNLLFDKLKNYGIPNSLLLWFGSYLSNRQQRVRANQCQSSWKPLMGGMPQGSWLGPLSFLVLINDLSAGCSVVKYVDDSTLSELLQPKSHASKMIQFLETY